MHPIWLQVSSIDSCGLCWSVQANVMFMTQSFTAVMSSRWQNLNKGNKYIDRLIACWWGCFLILKLLTKHQHMESPLVSWVVIDKTPSSGKPLSRALQCIYSKANPMSRCRVIATPDSEGIWSRLSRIDLRFRSKWGSRTYGDTHLGVSPKFLQEAQALPFFIFIHSLA
jgi:hypothetical protein